jgi:hypothetical protein
VKVLAQFVTPIKSNWSLDEGHQIHFLERIETPDLPPDILHCYEGGLCTLLRNINTLSGFVNGRRFWGLDAKERVAVIRFESGEQLTLSRIPIEKESNGMKFSKWQVPLKLIYTGTMHQSQGMTLNRAVIDLKREFWEHRGEADNSPSEETDRSV